MAVAVEAFRRPIPGNLHELKPANHLVRFDSAFQNADKRAYDVYKNGQWSLPRSYLASARRKVAIDDFDCLHPIRGKLEILGEIVRGWNYYGGDNGRHILSVEAFISGIHPELGMPYYEGQTPKETILGRLVVIEYDPNTLRPVVEIRDRLPRLEKAEQVKYCDVAGVPADHQTSEYFGLGLKASRFPAR